MGETVRPTKKQKQLLDFVSAFVAERGYGPSYREIMNGAGYKSVSTVAVHIDNLIARGHLRKRDHSARSLEVINSSPDAPASAKARPDQHKWLVDEVTKRLEAAETSNPSRQEVDNLYVLVGALHALGLEEAATSLKPRLLQISPTD